MLSASKSILCSPRFNYCRETTQDREHSPSPDVQSADPSASSDDEHSAQASLQLQRLGQTLEINEGPEGLRSVARSQGMATIAEESGLSRETLFRTLSDAGNPRLATLIGVLRAMGLRLSVTVACFVRCTRPWRHVRFIRTVVRKPPDSAAVRRKRSSTVCC